MVFMVSAEKKRVCVALDKEVAAHLEEMARRSGFSKSEVVNHILKGSNVVITTTSGARKEGFDYGKNF